MPVVGQDQSAGIHSAARTDVVPFEAQVDGQPVTTSRRLAVRSGQRLNISVTAKIPHGARMTELQIIAATPLWGLGPNGPFGSVQRIFDGAESATGTLSVAATWTASPIAEETTVTLTVIYTVIDDNGGYRAGHDLVVLDIGQ
jgi:hypothetical protein